MSILHLDSSGLGNQSATRKVTSSVVKAIQSQAHQDSIYRDLSEHLPLIDGQWMAANFTPLDEQNNDHKKTLSLSNQLIDELNAADFLVIGVPIYNFNIPAALKAWIDLITRAKVTFRYTESGPEGLVTPKKVYLVYASGGTPMGSAMDFATPYLKHILGFIGLNDVTLIDSKNFDEARFNI